ncbi:polysaccharide deacetylase family protein [Thalassotalea ponticola]|uniref:polysaccharide deacetylase family protein n=1 Tax=Thalassotalea ponticola TaxID=1523392 RepID=UPI0025B4EFE2|nr:polysaccharide deacetylase family protein [Thalassotalea ponticola]MDN3652423.1 polysaccharide deacetylase family protein [Thalassotalea ponticola]
MTNVLQRLQTRLIRTLKLEDVLFKRLPNGVYVFNLHRIGDRNASPFDRNIFSCGIEQFETFLQLLKANFTVIDLAALHEKLERKQVINKRLAVITFDDGYKDCVEFAAPLLQRYGLPAAFFVTTDFIASKRIPWWDEMAFLLRQSVGSSYDCICNNKTINLNQSVIEKQITQVLYACKRDKTHTIEQILNSMRTQFPQASKALGNYSAELFMNWQDIKQLISMGMEIGSHAKTHNILARMTGEQQLQELTLSKQILERRLNRSISYLAYPVGRYHCFDKQTLENARKAGYQLAFNNEKGKNQTITEPYSINRYCFDEGDISTLKLNCIVW